MHLGKKQPTANHSSVTDFLLLNFSEIQELQFLHFSVLLVLYLNAVTWNLLIITAVAFDHHLHTPMYFFLMNLALFDVGQVSVIFPKSMANAIQNVRLISYSGCAAQAFLFFLFISSDFFLLIIMAYDRYVAICDPLRYESVMTKNTCIDMLAIVWLMGLLFAVLHTISTFGSPFCSNVVHQFFCEIPQLLKLSCSSFYVVEIALIAVQAALNFTGCLFIIVSYVIIFTVVFRMPSMEGRKKAFSTCLPHLIVCSTLVVSASFAYLRPLSNAPSNVDVVFSMIYAMIPPTVNPVIYSMRNKEIKAALSKLFAMKSYLKNTFFKISFFPCGFGKPKTLAARFSGTKMATADSSGIRRSS